MGYRALTTVLIGIDTPVEPGELIPATFRDVHDQRHQVDFERLVELGAAEKIDAAAKQQPDPAPAGEDLDGLKRPELNELASAAGVQEPDKLPNKQAVIDALQAAGTTSEE